MKFLIVSVLAFLSHLPIVSGFSGGAGGCDNANGAAVSDFHLSNNPVVTGTLAENSLQFQLDGTTSLTAGVAASIVPGQSYTLNIVPAAGATFRGALIRVESTGTFTLTPGTNAQSATVCTSPIVGVTHTSPSDKTEFSGTFVADGAADYIVDVTVVISNLASTGSEYYHSQYLLQAADAAATTTPMATSTATPVATPVAEPTDTTGAPVVVVDQTSAPVAGPVDETEGPDESPTTAPAKGSEPTMESPTVEPMAMNETAPGETPTNYGPPTTTESNVTTPARAPAKTPVKPPVSTPTTSSASTITITSTLAVFVFIVMSVV